VKACHLPRHEMLDAPIIGWQCTRALGAKLYHKGPIGRERRLGIRQSRPPTPLWQCVAFSRCLCHDRKIYELSVITDRTIKFMKCSCIWAKRPNLGAATRKAFDYRSNAVQSGRTTGSSRRNIFWPLAPCVWIRGTAACAGASRPLLTSPLLGDAALSGRGSRPPDHQR
jgi:hypothetical protein